MIELVEDGHNLKVIAHILSEGNCSRVSCRKNLDCKGWESDSYYLFRGCPLHYNNGCSKGGIYAKKRAEEWVLKNNITQADLLPYLFEGGTNG